MGIQSYINKIFKRKQVESIKFSIIMPTYNVDPKWLKKTIRSVKEQIYHNWELCIVDDGSKNDSTTNFLEHLNNKSIKIKLSKENRGISEATNDCFSMSSGEYIIFLDHDDILFPNALESCYSAIINNNYPDVLYSDQDIIDEEDRHSCPLFKPDWSPDLLNSQMYIGHMLAIRRETLIMAGGFRKEYDGSQDYDLMLRISEQTNKIHHISEVLYSWRSIPTSTAANPSAKPQCQITGMKAVQDHLDRTYGRGRACAYETDNLFVYDVRYNYDFEPKISIIIPTKDHADFLQPLINDIFESNYKNFEIIIINNNSVEDTTLKFFDGICHRYSNVKVIDAKIEFNWSKLNNIGIDNSVGDVFIFLNNDIRIISKDWMERLAEYALREDVGAVGPLLLYEDDTIQHAGVVIGIGGYADHIYKGQAPIHCGTPYISPMVNRNVSAVTGACMAVSKSTLEVIGKFDDNFIICGSDVEYCIRALNHGYRNVYLSNVRLYHFESKTRDSYIPQIDYEMSQKAYSPFIMNGDPMYNCNLSYESCKPAQK